MKDCCMLGTKTQKQQLDELVKNATQKKHTVVKILQETQGIYGFLPESVIDYLSQKLKISVSEIYSVASFYAEFSFKPKGKFPISICMGTACYVNGAEGIFNKIVQILNLKDGECSADGKFSIDQTRCIGCCGMAPVLTIGEDVYGNVQLKDVEKILSKYMENR